MTGADYIARLQRHLADYKSGFLGVHESGSWGKPPRHYPHILPPDRRELNIVASFREAFWRSQRRSGWKLHKYFHHLSSSQALAFNIFFPLYPHVPSGMPATRRILGLPDEAVCQVDFEAVLDAVEGTNIDALVETGEGTRTIVEVKLTERGFGGAREDERHLAKLADVYRPLLLGRVEPSCLEPSAFFRDYQLYRNLAQIRRDTADRVLLLIPRARRRLWQHANAWCDSQALGSLRGCIRVAAIEDLISALSADSEHADIDNAAIAEVSRKYIVPAG
jgi:hypothetical protein